MTPFPRSAVFDGARLAAVGGVAVEQLAATWGTPLYVLDRAELVARIQAYRRAFGDDVAIVYAAKALCVVGLLQLVAGEGLGVDVTSAGELCTAERAGFPMARVVFHGNNKSREELADAVRLGVGRIVVDSPAELERVAALGARRGSPVAVLLRVTPGVAASTHAFIATGHDDVKFGFPLSTGMAADAVATALALPGVDVRGLHCHIGSQITASGGFQAAATALCRLRAEVHARCGTALPELNLGGGLGIAYTRDDEVLGIDEYAGDLLAAVHAQTADDGLSAPRVTVEPGRSLVGPAGVTLYTVGTVKHEPRLRTWASVDGGMSDNLRPALYGARYEVVAAGAPHAATVDTRRYAVAGKHCETGDVVAADVELPADLGEGDLLAVAATGAYGYAMASNYNRLPRPAMVMVGDGRVELVVRRETVEDVLSHDVALSAGGPTLRPYTARP
ncbi:MAG: diaminopimelate decarboxylase [Actinomycetota bacterium]|nr:diaminopimelate decarboxylase [Actinomycetota bacterium]